MLEATVPKRTCPGSRSARVIGDEMSIVNRSKRRILKPLFDGCIIGAGSSPRQARTDWSFWLDERLFSNRLLASRTSRLLSQKEIISTALARNPCQNPVERNLGIRRMATLAGLDHRFGFADGVAVYRDQFNSWPLQKFVPIESTLQCPLIFVLVVGQEVCLPIGCADFEKTASRRAPLFLDGSNFVQFVIQFKLPRRLIGFL